MNVSDHPKFLKVNMNVHIVPFYWVLSQGGDKTVKRIIKRSSKRSGTLDANEHSNLGRTNALKQIVESAHASKKNERSSAP